MQSSEIVELIKEYSGYSLTKTTLRSEEKFNVFIWSPGKGGKY